MSNIIFEATWTSVTSLKWWPLNWSLISREVKSHMVWDKEHVVGGEAAQYHAWW